MKFLILVPVLALIACGSGSDSNTPGEPDPSTDTPVADPVEPDPVEPNPSEPDPAEPDPTVPDPVEPDPDPIEPEFEIEMPVEPVAPPQPPVVDPQPETVADTDCAPELGTDAYSVTPNWNDNCTISREGEFSTSLYTMGIQRILFCAGYLDGASVESASNGEFGLATEQAVMTFQLANALTDDGFVDAQTWNALQNALDIVTAGEIDDSGVAYDSYSVGDCDVLFFQELTLTDSGNDVLLGQWFLANGNDRIPFSIDPPITDN